MYFIGGGVGGPGCPSRGQYPRAAKNPLKPPLPKPPLFLNLALGGFLSRISDFREPPPPLGLLWIDHAALVRVSRFTAGPSCCLCLLCHSVVCTPGPHLPTCITAFVRTPYSSISL